MKKIGTILVWLWWFVGIALANGFWSTLAFYLVAEVIAEAIT